MEAGSADEAVLARAAELYAEGMTLEDANEPQVALDRYRRAVRMADERKILARLQAERPQLFGCGGSSGAAAPPPQPPPQPPPTVVGPSAKQSAEEDFQLWRAMHVSRLEAEAAGNAAEVGASTASGRDEAGHAEGSRGEALPSRPAQQACAARGMSSSSGGPFQPPPRKSPAAPPPKEEDEEEEPGSEEDAEEADRMALCMLQRRLGPANEAAASQDGPLPAAASAPPQLVGSDEQSAEDTARLTRMLPEVLPDIFAFLDPYGLDRSSPACKTLRRLSRSSAVWSELARRCLSRAEHEHLAACAASGDEQLWRRTLLFAPRFRTDGIYIAQCGYRRRIQKGSSLTDTRESMYITYHRLLRALPEDEAGSDDPQQRVLVLTYEGDLTIAVEALKTHPAGRTATFGKSPKALAEVPAAARKLHERALLGSYTLDRGQMLVTVRHSDARNKYAMEFALANGRKNGSRQNCRLTWLRYEFTSLTVPEDGGSYDLRRERHYAPYAFARVRALEHVL